MRILIFNFEYPPLGGGGGVATKEIAQELAKRHAVTVITTAFQDLPRHERIDEVEVIRVPVIGRRTLPTASLISMLTFLPRALWAGWQVVRRQRFDVINAQFVIPSGIPAAMLSFLTRIPLVISFIGGDIYDPTKGISPHRHPLLRMLIRWIVRQAVICTAISSDTKRRAQLLHNVKKEIVITHLGLLPATVALKTRVELGLDETGLYAVTIGRLIPRKAYEILFEAWQHIPQAKLLVIGDGPLKEKLTKLLEKYSLQDRVTLLGFVDETKKQQLLRVSDIYVSAAEHEGFGIVFLEAMEAGLPLVTVNDGGQTDFLQPGINALLVDPKNAQDLAVAVNELLKDPQRRKTMAAQNKLTVKDFYLPQTVARFEDVLMGVARKPIV